MRITREEALGGAHAEQFYRLYASAFLPIVDRAAARHLLSEHEFAGEMADKRIDKYVAWDDEGHPIGLATFTTDLTTVAWIQPEFYAARYADEMARGAIFYMGYMLVDKSRADTRIFRGLLETLSARVRAARGICVFDVSTYNDAGPIGQMWRKFAENGIADVEKLDTQIYYAASFAEATAEYAATDFLPAGAEPPPGGTR